MKILDANGSVLANLEVREGRLTVETITSVLTRVFFAICAALGVLLVLAALHQSDTVGRLAGAAFGLVFVVVGVWGAGQSFVHHIDRDAGTIERVRSWGGLVLARWRSTIGAHTTVRVERAEGNDEMFEVFISASAGDSLLAGARSAPCAEQLAAQVRSYLHGGSLAQDARDG